MADFCINTTYKYELDKKYCYVCNRYYAVLTNISASGGFRCPYCTHTHNETLSNKIEQLRRSNAGLRGAVKRLSKKNKGT